MTAEAIDHTAPSIPQPLLRTVPSPSYAPLVLCGCGHERDTHEHLRAGSDCGICGPVRCRSFRKRSGRGVRPLYRRMAG